jgi:hypothetical protein
MGDEDAFRLGGRSGRKDDFRHVVARDLHGRRGTFGPDKLVQLPHGEVGNIRDVYARDPRHPMPPGWRVERRYILTDDQQLRRNDAAHALEKGWRRPVVDRHDDDAVQDASPEGDDPFRAVLAPEDDLVAFSQPELMQPRREAASRPHHLFVGV